MAGKPHSTPSLDELGDILGGQYAYTQGFWEDVQAFLHAVDWRNDRWLFGLFAVEAMILSFVVFSRRHWERMSFIFLVNSGILFFAERLNTLAATHWKSFSTQMYFDSAGAFAGVVLGMPLVLIQFLLVIFLLREASCMVIKVKRLELRANHAAQNTGESRKDR